MIHLYTDKKCLVFKPFLILFSYLLTKNSIENKIVTSYQESADLWFIIWFPFIKAIPPNSILYIMDPNSNFIIEGFNQIVRNYRSNILHVLHYSDGISNHHVLQHQIPMTIMRYGWSEYYQLEAKDNKQIPFQGRPIDILFFGSLTYRRKKFLKIVSDYCQENNYVLEIYDGKENPLYNDKKVEVIRNSKIVLGITSNMPDTMSTNDLARISQVICLGGFIITEKLAHSQTQDVLSQFIPHYQNETEMIQLIDYYLKNIDQLKDLSARLKENYNLDQDFIKNISQFEYIYKCHQNPRQNYLDRLQKIIDPLLISNMHQLNLDYLINSNLR